MKRLLPSALALGIALALAWAATAALSQPPTVHTVNTGQHFLPPYPNDRDRFGFDSNAGDPLTNYDVAALHAGWYSDWAASLNPPHPDDLTYVQLIRFKAGSDPHDPAQVTVSPGRSTIARIAAAHPGSLWLMSNEPDSLYQGNPIYPDVYAQVYHEYYYYIKSLDPTALIANGGIVQPTPCRLTYLDIVWDTYQQLYGEEWPVDVWNIHAFILREVYGSWGASTPPGVDRNCGINYKIRDGDDINIFRDNLIAFRQWMKDKGEQDKPLIISEYGVLWPDWLKDEDGVGFPPARVSHFMTQTFDLFLNETYPDVGYPADDYRLVQAWAWYSLSDDSYYNGYLFYHSSRTISPMGETYAAYTAALSDTRYADLTLSVISPVTDSLEHIPLGDPYGTTSVTIPIWAYVGNLGKVPVDDPVPLVTYLSPPVTYSVTAAARYTADIQPFLVATIALTCPAVYEFSDITVAVDPAHTVADPRPWNNVATVTLPSVVDARPDLQLTRLVSDYLTDAGLYITITIANGGIWPSPPVSASLVLSDLHGSLLIPIARLAIPPLTFGDEITMTAHLTAPNPGLYALTATVDDAAQVDEQDEANNRVQTTVDLRPNLTVSIVEGSTCVLGSGDLYVTYTIANAGLTEAAATSGTRSLDNTFGTLVFATERFSIPPLLPGAALTHTCRMSLTSSEEDFYRFAVAVDDDDLLDEMDENDNQALLMVPILVTETLLPDSAAVITSSAGDLVLFVPTGTVTVPTNLEFVPVWPTELPPGLWRAAMAFRLAAYQDGQTVAYPFNRPLTVTWWYTDSDIAGMDEADLDFFRWDVASWQRIGLERTAPEMNRVRASTWDTGLHAFGWRRKYYLPLIVHTAQ